MERHFCSCSPSGRPVANCFDSFPCLLCCCGGRRLRLRIRGAHRPGSSDRRKRTANVIETVSNSKRRFSNAFFQNPFSCSPHLTFQSLDWNGAIFTISGSYNESVIFGTKLHFNSSFSSDRDCLPRHFFIQFFSPPMLHPFVHLFPLSFIYFFH